MNAHGAPTNKLATDTKTRGCNPLSDPGDCGSCFPADPRRRICAYYSHGPHYRSTIHALRDAYPGACLAAMVPPDLPVLDELRASVDEIIQTEQTHYSLRNIPACRRLLRQIRAARYDVFAVMFNSGLLRLLAPLSGAPTCLHATPDGRLVPLSASTTVALAQTALRNITGHLAYAIAFLAVRFLHVRDRVEK